MLQIVGLTGSIAMGKSHAARMFQRFGVPVFDSDAAVHRLFRAPSPLPARIAREFGDVLDADGHVDRQELGAAVLGEPAALKRLEALVHPAVFEAQHTFLKTAARTHFERAVLDIPLLFEGDRAERFDAVLVVDCSRQLQRQRAMTRRGMTPAKFEAILAKQMPAAKKRKRADFIITSGYDRGQTHRQIATALAWLDDRPATAWPMRWQ